MNNLVDGGVITSRIGVMSPFRKFEICAFPISKQGFLFSRTNLDYVAGGQVVLIRQYLRSKNFFDVNVGTIENYQGVEQDVIIFSLTRSNPAFVQHDIKRRMGVLGVSRYKQANVALTRAENLFVMIGNPEVMWDDMLWRQWLMFCFRNGLWFGRGLEEKKIQTIMSSEGREIMSSPNQHMDKESSTIVSTIEKVNRITC